VVQALVAARSAASELIWLQLRCRSIQCCRSASSPLGVLVPVCDRRRGAPVTTPPTRRIWDTPC